MSVRFIVFFYHFQIATFVFKSADSASVVWIISVNFSLCVFPELLNKSNDFCTWWATFCLGNHKVIVVIFRIHRSNMRTFDEFLVVPLIAYASCNSTNSTNRSIQINTISQRVLTLYVFLRIPVTSIDYWTSNAFCSYNQKQTILIDEALYSIEVTRHINFVQSYGWVSSKKTAPRVYLQMLVGIFSINALCLLATQPQETVYLSCRQSITTLNNRKYLHLHDNSTLFSLLVVQIQLLKCWQLFAG